MFLSRARKQAVFGVFQHPASLARISHRVREECRWNACWHECQHCTHECVRHRCIQSTHVDRSCEKWGLEAQARSWEGLGSSGCVTASSFGGIIMGNNGLLRRAAVALSIAALFATAGWAQPAKELPGSTECVNCHDQGRQKGKRE